jgi:hypothetical protein
MGQWIRRHRRGSPRHHAIKLSSATLLFEVLVGCGAERGRQAAEENQVPTITFTWSAPEA